MQIFLIFYTQKKIYFFYFAHLFLQNTHISLSILYIYSIKYSFFYNFLLFSPLSPLSLTDPIRNPFNHLSLPHRLFLSLCLSFKVSFFIMQSHHPPRSALDPFKSANRPIQDPKSSPTPISPRPIQVDE